MTEAPETRSTVFIVDDDDAVGDALMLLMKSVRQPALRFRGAQEFLDSYAPATPGCLLLDIRMPGMSGFELQKEMARRDIRLPVIFMTGHGDVPMAVGAMREGAVDFLQKPFRDEELLASVNRALARDRGQQAALRLREDRQNQLAKLTTRELEIARRVADGRANKFIAAELGISSRTVELHRAHVMEKLGLKSVAELVRFFVDAEQPT
jgi:FixJ family two-component response regulator